MDGIVAAVTLAYLQPVRLCRLRMMTVMVVMVTMCLIFAVMVMHLLAIVICKHAEQLHRMVAGAFVDLETRECRQIDHQQQHYRDIACKLFHSRSYLISVMKGIRA